MPPAMLRAFGEGNLFGEAWGEGKPWVLALHGWRRTHADFQTLFGPESGLAGIVLDLPGFGATPPPPQAWGAAQYAEAVALVLAEFPEPPVVVGHSFGGRVAVHLAATHPGAVRALVLTGVPLLRPEASGRAIRPPLPFRLARALHARRLLGDRRMEAYRQRYGSSDYRLAEGVMRQVLVRSVAETYEAELVAIKDPIEMVWGDDDSAAPLTMARAVVKLIEEEGSAPVRLSVCPGAGHMTPLTAAEALRQAVIAHRGDSGHM
ncbi:MAG: alpha/beta fold hydrolase [Acidimicrobiales bacterium]